MCDSSKYEIIGTNSHFPSVSESEILRIQEVVVPHKKWLQKFGLKVFKEQKRPTDIRLLSSFRVSGNVLGNRRFHKSKQNGPPSTFSLGIGRNECRSIHWQKHQKQFNKALTNSQHLSKMVSIYTTKISLNWGFYNPTQFSTQSEYFFSTVCFQNSAQC